MNNCPYEREQKRLQKLYDEVSLETEYEVISGDDGEFDSDPNFNPDGEESSSDDGAEPIKMQQANSRKQTSMEPSSSANQDGSDDQYGSDDQDGSDVPDVPESAEEGWQSDTQDISDFKFEENESGCKVNINPQDSPMDVFQQFFTEDVISLISQYTNEYGRILTTTNLPPTRYRKRVFREANSAEIKIFLGLCLLQAQVSSPQRRQLFSTDALYFHPIFSHVMTGRRFEQILQCLSCAPKGSERMEKVNPLLNILLNRFQSCLYPQKQLSLDESLLLHRGRLIFRTYMKGKKAKYGIKFYELCTFDGYVLNIEIYTGLQKEVVTSKIGDLVLRLMAPYLDKGHVLFMDNYYNSVTLSKILLLRKTHTTGTLRRTRRGNPTLVTQKKLKGGEYLWRRQGKIYVSKWKDKREVLSICTANLPGMIETQNRYGKKAIKPREIVEYNRFMSGVDRCYQMVSYYSSPRKTIKWNKKVIFHLLDVSVWNSFYLYRKMCKNVRYLQFREELIRQLIGIDKTLTPKELTLKYSRGKFNGVGKKRKQEETFRELDDMPHFPEKIPPDYKRKTYFLRCRMCTKNNTRKETSYRCMGCNDKPALCPECFQSWHMNAI